MEVLDQAEGGQPRELRSPLSTGQGHFLKSPHASVYTRADLREGSDVTILICREPTSAHFSLTLNLPTTTIVAQPFNIIKWQVKFNPVA